MRDSAQTRHELTECDALCTTWVTPLACTGRVRPLSRGRIHFRCSTKATPRCLRSPWEWRLRVMAGPSGGAARMTPWRLEARNEAYFLLVCFDSQGRDDRMMRRNRKD